MNTRGLRNAVGAITPLYFLLGAFSLVFQTILLREFFTVAAGNEISFAFALGGWLLGVGAGSCCSGFLSVKLRRLTLDFSLTVICLCLCSPLLLICVRCLKQLGFSTQGTLIPLSMTFWLIPLLTVPFSFFSGFVFPLAAKLQPASPLSDTQKLIQAYIWECLGALAGGLVYTFWLLEKFNSILIITFFTLPLLFASTIIVASEKKKKTLVIGCLLLVFNLYASMFGGSEKLDAWLVKQRWLGLSTATWLESRDSKYQNLQLGVSHGQYSLYGNGQLAAIFPDDDQQRIQAAQIITQHPDPQRILIIGEGASGLARHLLQYKITSLISVEIDGEFLDLILNHLSASAIKSLSDPRLRMPVLDGRRFVMEAAKTQSRPENRFDLIYLHQPDAWTAQFNRYYTREFFMALKTILTNGGVVAMRVTSAENYASEITNPYTATIYQTLKYVFPSIVIAQGPKNFFFASQASGSTSSIPSLLADRYNRLAYPPADLGTIFNSLYPDEKTGFIKKTLEQYPVQALNRDQQPIAYFLCSRLLGWTSGSPLSGLFDFFEKLQFSNLLVLIISMFFLTFLWNFINRKKTSSNFPILLAAASGGFAGLAFEILTIFTFQNIWGYIYQTIGLLIASFMMGMGLGAHLTGCYLHKNQPSPAQSRKMLAGDQLLIAFISLASIPLMSFFAKLTVAVGQIAMYSWLGGMGFLVGAILPLALHIYSRESAAQKAGFLNAADYWGGTFGALFTASFLLPLYGSVNSMLIIAIVALATAMLLLPKTRFNDSEAK